MKKKHLFLIILLLFVVSPVFASPFLVCDPPTAEDKPNIDYYEIDGLPTPLSGKDIPADTTGKYGFKYDLAALPSGGPWTLTARACNQVWGCSENSLPYVLNRPPKWGQIIKNIQLIK